MGRTEKSRAAGILIYKENPRRYLLLFKQGKGHPEFPKGAIEEGENKVQAARREVEEETGLQGLKLHPGFEKHIRYKFNASEERGLTIRRQVTYFLAKAPRKKVRLSKEHKRFLWATVEEAKKIFKHRNYKNLLIAAERHLNQS